MKLYKLLLTNNDCYKRNQYITPKGIMVHSTGANNPYIKRYVGPDDGRVGKNTGNNHWNMPGVSVCVHAFIGKLNDGSIATYQTLPWNMRGWHSASGSKGSANNTHISFEICEDDLKSSTYFNKVYKEAVELTAYLCKLYNLDPMKDGVIICHSEGYKRGIASNHRDVMHWFPKYGKSMDTFRSDVNKLLVNTTPIKDNKQDTLGFKVNDIVSFSGGKQYIDASAINGSNVQSSMVKITQIYKSGKHPYHVRSVNSDGRFVSGVYGWVDSSTLSVKDNQKVPYLVKVTASKLNIRKLPTINSSVVGTIKDQSVYTIIEENNGWGKLKSEIGWISLSYTKKV